MSNTVRPKHSAAAENEHRVTLFSKPNDNQVIKY